MQNREMSNKGMKIASGVIAGSIAATAIGIALTTTKKPKSKMQKSTARTLNTISHITHSLANIIG